jgi:cobaltochelatase CobN
MHLLARETQTLDAQEQAVDLGHEPAELVFLSFSDSDLGAWAAAWEALDGEKPSLQLASLAWLRHPMSVDLYMERVISAARCVVIRLLGGVDYWPYGIQEVAALCRQQGIALAVVPGDGAADTRLAELSTVPPDKLRRLDAFLRQGGPANLALGLHLAIHLAGLGPDGGEHAKTVPNAGVHTLPCAGDGPVCAIIFYRAHLLAGDFAPIEALGAALAQRGLAARAIYVSSLKDKDAAAFVATRLRAWQPAVVLNATGFSARREDAAESPLEAAGAPVLQLVLAGTSKPAWEASYRGLSQADLAMHVVLPELDGRLLTTAISFKAEAVSPDGRLARTVNCPDASGIALAADRAAGWARLAGTKPGARRLALVLSDYPGAGGQIGHAVGLDSLASLRAIFRMLSAAGYDCAGELDMSALTQQAPRGFMTVVEYERQFAALPAELQARIAAAWGAPADDPAVSGDAFALRHIRQGAVTVAVQPERGHLLDRKAGYHDADLPPRHGYVAFHLWLRTALDVHAVVHLGTHGTLEWLQGKAVALSDMCAPAALLRGLPVIYPFIVNNPGEAAVAKRRLGAVTIGHMTPPLASAGAHGAVAELERLIDEYAAADGLDRRRGALLRQEILDRAGASGLLRESGVAKDASDDEALARLDAYLCDVKDMQIRDGLHVFGEKPRDVGALLDALCRACPSLPAPALRTALEACASAEATALLAALDGRFVAPGPAGAPTRGRADVLPTGRNLFAVDPRAIPTRSACVLAEKSAADLLRRHRQDHGEWMRSVVIDLWGSATMRTGGEDLALALVLLGARPVWDDGSARVTGIEVIPLALLDRPRVDVTLRISGLFRDTFETQILLFDTAVRAVAARDEAADWNSLAAAAHGLQGAALRRATTRIYGAAPGQYGAGGEAIERGDWQDRATLGASYIAASATAYGKDTGEVDGAAGFAARVTAADAFVHQQDHAETDLLDSTDYAAHEGGFAAAADMLGASPAIYHTDISDPQAPRTRLLAEEIARVVRGRAANPVWIGGMMRHGYRGAAEIARTVEGLHGFAAMLPQRLDAQFDLLFDATLGDADVAAFLQDNNPDARAAMAGRFADALRRNLWRPRRNAVAAALAAP